MSPETLSFSAIVAAVRCVRVCTGEEGGVGCCRAQDSCLETLVELDKVEVGDEGYARRGRMRAAGWRPWGF